MSRTGSALLASLVLICSLSVWFPPVARSGETILFRDDFSRELSRHWIPFFLPGPGITRSRGNPPPALGNGGGGKERNGVISKRLFPLDPGVVLRADIFLSPAGGEAVFGGSLGFPLNPEVFLRGQWPEWLVGISYDYIGETEWSRGVIPEGGTLTCSLVNEDGSLEISRRPYLNCWLGGWHSFEIKIKKSGFVEFRLDGDLVYYSRKRLAFGYPQLPLLLGQLSGGQGKVCHDNVEVRAGVAPSRPDPR